MKRIEKKKTINILGNYQSIWRLPMHGGYPIETFNMDDHDFVLKRMVTLGSPNFEKQTYLQCEAPKL
jgi:hypothetical protein